MRWNEGGEKWIEGAIIGIYTAFLQTEYLNNIIFNYFVGEFLKFHR
jgi:hypothetical protein